MALMSSKINVIIILNALFNVIPIVKTSRADLGTYLHIAPAVEEKTHEELYVLAFINYTYMDDGREVFYSEEKGRYGEGKILNVQGYLEHITSADDVNDHTGCTSNIRGTNGNPLPPLSYITANNGGGGISAKPWIALIRRGKCTFEEKIKYAWKHGAVGVIVYNEIPAVSLEKMKIIEKERNITAIFTYKWIGEELGRIVDSGNHIWVSISEGQRGLKPQHNINKTSVLFVSISFIVLMIISLVWLIFYYIQRFRYLQSKDQHSRHLCAVAKRVIMKIPTKSGKNDDKDSENDCCAICIEPYKATDCIRVLPCNHEFHKNCIDPWLLEHRTCPMCKLDVLKHYGFVCTLHNHCPAQANRVFWEVFPTRYLGSEESILQLDLDMEIGDHGLNSGDDDRFSIDNPRISHTIPTFHIQTFDDHSHLVRNLPSIESMHNNNNNHHHHHNPNHYHQHQLHYPDDLPERSQSSLSCINRMLDETITNKLFPHNQQSQQDRANGKDTKTNSTTATTACTTTAIKLNNFLSPDTYKKNKESVSLPGTLKKKRSSSDSCRGSNNCYIKAAAADLKQLAVKIEKGCPKSRTAIVRQASDDEHLLDNDNNTVDITTEPASAGIKATKSSALNTDGGGDDTVSLAVTKSQGALRKTSGGSSGASAAATSSSSSSASASAIAIVPPQIRIEIEPSSNSVGDDSTTNQRPR